MNANDSLRAGDPDRNAALDRLGKYFADGYLNVNEFDERSGRAATAQTHGELTQLFSDLPQHTGGELATPASSELLSEAKAQDELDEVVKRNRKVQAVDSVIWAVAMIVFFVGLFLLEWDYFWVVFPIAAFATWGAHAAFGLSDEDEKVANELEKEEKKARAERLRHAAEKRRELGK